MKKALTLVLGLAAAQAGMAQNTADKYAETITEKDLYQYESVLASDVLAGRETGKAGQYMAAGYLRAHFEQNGLQAPVNNSYYQPVALEETGIKSATLTANGKTLTHLEDFLLVKSPKGMSLTKNMDVVFAGKGTDKDFDGIDVADKAVVLFSETTRGWFNIYEAKKEEGVQAFFVVVSESDEKFAEQMKPWKHYLSKPKMGLKTEDAPEQEPLVYFISPGQAADILGTSFEKMEKAMAKNESSKRNALKRFKAKDVQVAIEAEVKEIKSENVLGYIEGSDKKDELIVVTAHYDHVGVDGDKIFNGADDDASGTAAVMEMAQAFAMAKADGNGPRRSMLFMLVTGEEKGLLGSDYYTQNPIFPLENTVCNLNIDMIGRVDPAHEGNPDYIYLIGSDKLSMDLHNLSEKVNKETVNLELDYTYNDENDPNRYYYRSDHYNFAKNNIPVIFYFNGTHEDYHKHTDTIDKLNLPKMEKISRLVFYTAWELANRDERIKLSATAKK